MGLEFLRGKHAGCTAFIIGKGPSLDALDRGVLTHYKDNGPVLCVNQSVRVVENWELGGRALYVVQQDHDKRLACVPRSENAIHFLNGRGPKGLLASPPDWAPRAVLYNPEEFGENVSTLTAIMALHIAKLMGCVGVIFVAFDAMLPGGSCEYAASMGPQDGRAGSIERHRTHGTVILDQCKRLGLLSSVCCSAQSEKR